MGQRFLNLHISFEKGIRNVFQISSFIVLAGNALDILKFAHINKFITYENSINIIIVAGVLTLYYLKKINYKAGFTVLIYSMLINMYIGKYVSYIDLSDPLRVNFFLRDSLFIILLLMLASFALNKLHSIIIGSSYLIFAFSFKYLIKNSFLDESIILIAIAILAYIGLTYYLVIMFEKTLNDQQQNNDMIQKQNNELNKANSLLLERQQQIEEQTQAIELQSEKLIRQAEELRNKNVELSRLNTSKDIFFSIIAHDLKNPFNIILGFASILKKRFKSLTNEKRMHYVDRIESTAGKTYCLLENLLEWARSQTDSMEINTENISLNSIIQNVLELYHENINNKSLNILYKPEKDYRIFADQSMMSTVVRNLISNAIKFSYDNTDISILLKENTSFVCCSIKDQGMGISGEMVPYLFDLEKNWSTKGTKGESGTGLGMIITKNFIEKNNGRIEVESSVKKGSTFTFYVPRFSEH